VRTARWVVRRVRRLVMRARWVLTAIREALQRQHTQHIPFLVFLPLLPLLISDPLHSLVLPPWRGEGRRAEAGDTPYDLNLFLFLLFLLMLGSTLFARGALRGALRGPFPATRGSQGESRRGGSAYGREEEGVREGRGGNSRGKRKRRRRTSVSKATPSSPQSPPLLLVLLLLLLLYPGRDPLLHYRRVELVRG